MYKTRFGLAIAALVLAFPAPALAEDKCSVKTVLGGKPVTMKYCAAAMYDSGPSVMLWFSDAPFTAKELEAFHESSATPDKTPEGKPRTQLHFAFCPGAGKPDASAAAVKSVETSIEVAGAPFSGRQWVFRAAQGKGHPEDREADGDDGPGREILRPHHRRQGQRRIEVLVGSRLRLHPAREVRVRGTGLRELKLMDLTRYRPPIVAQTHVDSCWAAVLERLVDRRRADSRASISSLIRRWGEGGTGGITPLTKIPVISAALGLSWGGFDSDGLVTYLEAHLPESHIFCAYRRGAYCHAILIYR